VANVELVVATGDAAATAGNNQPKMLAEEM
jgi:hypothetical protein